MPFPPTVQGYTGLTQAVQLCLENNQSAPGEPLLMPQTAGAATMSLTTQPSALSPTTGMQLHIFVIGNAASGTITIAGINPSGGNVTSQTYHLLPAPQNAAGYTDFTTTEIFATVNASGITLSSGLTTAGCQVMIFGSAAGKYLLPITADAEEKITHFSPTDKRGILFKNFRVSQLTKGASLDKFDCALYPDMLWAYYMLIGTPSASATVPAAPVSLLAATTKAATMTLTTTPPGPGMFLIFTPGANSIAGTIVLSGTDNDGFAVSETITVGANNNPVYSAHRYSALTSPGSNQFTTTGLSVGATLAVTAVYGWTYTFTYDGINNLPPLSACLSIFDGVMGKKLPGTILTDGTFDWQKEKEIAFSGKGLCQDYCIVGDPNPTTYPSGTNPFATLTQPTSLPIVSWPASWYIDAGTGTPFTTQDGSLLTCKIAVSTGRKWIFAGDGMQRASFVITDADPDISADATMIFQNYANYVAYFKPNMPLILATQFRGKLLGSYSSTTYFENVKWTLPMKIDTDKPDMSKNPVEIALKLMSEYNFANLGYAFQAAVTAAVPPTYLN